MVEVVTRDVTSSTFLVSGLSRVQCGFSFPVPNALHQYDVAMEAAVAAHCGGSGDWAVHGSTRGHALVS